MSDYENIWSIKMQHFSSKGKYFREREIASKEKLSQVSKVIISYETGGLIIISPWFWLYHCFPDIKGKN